MPGSQSLTCVGEGLPCPRSLAGFSLPFTLLLPAFLKAGSGRQDLVPALFREELLEQCGSASCPWPWCSWSHGTAPLSQVPNLDAYSYNGSVVPFHRLDLGFSVSTWHSGNEDGSSDLFPVVSVGFLTVLTSPGLVLFNISHALWT